MSDGSVLSCGASCTACPAPANATATCTGGSCDYTCAAGYAKSGGGCIPCTSPSSCGSDCGACPVPAGADGATCSGNTAPAATSCGAHCQPGFQLSGGKCAACNTLAACGVDCQACPGDPLGGTYSCGGNSTASSQACQLACASGYDLKGNTCVTHGWQPYCTPIACNDLCKEGCGGGGPGGGGGIACYGKYESVRFADRAHGVIAGSGYVLATKDGGKSWNANAIGKCDLQVTYPTTSLAMVTDRTGGILVSADEGDSWTDVSIAGADLNRVTATGAESWAAGLFAGSPALFHQAGTSAWSAVVPSPLASAARSIFALSGGNAWVTDGAVHRTTDGGATWATSCDGCDARTLAIASSRAFTHDQCAVRVSNDKGATWGDRAEVICDYGTLYGLDVADSSNVWVAGAVGPTVHDDGVVYRSKLGGASGSWYHQSIPALSRPITSIDIIDLTQGQAVGYDFAAFVTTSGGD